MIELRNYQQKLIDDLRDEIKKGNRRIICVAPTGSGKNIINGFITKNALLNGNTIMTIVHRKELVDDLSKTLAGLEINHGKIIAGTKITNHMCHVASVQTLIRKIKDVSPPDIVVIDEAHHLTKGNSWGKVIESWPSSIVIGLTATPTRLDKKGLGSKGGGYFDSMVVGPSVKSLIATGYLSDYDLYAPKLNIDLKGVKTSMGDYAKGELDSRVNKHSITGDAVKHYKKICPTSKGIIFCVSIDHSKNVAKEFNENGISCAHIDGTIPSAERAKILADYENDKYQVLTNVALFGEGFNLPKIQTVQILRPTQSLGLWRQMIGRGLRTHEGKNAAIIIDHVRGTEKHGLPDDKIEWDLNPTKKKVATVSKIAIKTCPNCFRVHVPTIECPFCGYKYRYEESKVEFNDEELVKITKKDKELLKRKRRMEVAQARTYEELEVIRKQRGYKFGWSRIKINERRKKRNRYYEENNASSFQD